MTYRIHLYEYIDLSNMPTSILEQVLVAAIKFTMPYENLYMYIYTKRNKLWGLVELVFLEFGTFRSFTLVYKVS